MIQYIKSILGLFDRRTHWQLAGLSGLMLFTALLEMIGLGLFLPLLQIIADPNVLDTNPYIAKAVDVLGNGSLDRFTIVFAGLLLAFFLVKNLILFGLTLLQNVFVLKKQALLQGRILHNYVSRPYVFHLGRNTANLTRNITQSAAMLFTRGLLPLLNIMMEVLLVLAVVVILLATELLATMTVAGVFIVITGGFYILTQGVLADWSHRREAHAEKMIRMINEGVGSVKETKILGRENFFVRVFRREALGQAKCQAFTSSLTQLPRNVTEVIAIAGLGLVLLFILGKGDEIQAAIPVMGLFALATFRLVPSANRIISAIATVRSGIASVGSITMDFKDYVGVEDDDVSAPEERRPLPFEREIALIGLGYRYAGTDTRVLSDINFTIAKGESIALVGESGAGKTTLADLILGVLSPTEGHMLIDGNDIAGSVRRWQARLGYIPQNIYLTDDSIRRNIALGLDDADIDDGAVDRAVRLARLESVVAQLPDGLSSLVGEHGVRLSGGQRQRIGIARALYHNPDVLVMDEATSALDSQTEHDITNAINDLKGSKTIIIIAHRLSTVRSCDRLCVMAGGRISGIGTFDELKSGNETFAKLVALADLWGTPQS